MKAAHEDSAKMLFHDQNYHNDHDLMVNDYDYDDNDHGHDHYYHHDHNYKRSSW